MGKQAENLAESRMELRTVIEKHERYKTLMQSILEKKDLEHQKILQRLNEEHDKERTKILEEGDLLLEKERVKLTDLHGRELRNVLENKEQSVDGLKSQIMELKEKHGATVEK